MVNSYPLKVDPEFFKMAKEMVQKDPSLNMRKVTKKISQKKEIIGQIMFNEEFEKHINEIQKKFWEKGFNP